jgi:hypothetical protein
MVLRPSQAWYWSKEWQAGEDEADEDIRKGRVTQYRLFGDIEDGRWLDDDEEDD